MRNTNIRKDILNAARYFYLLQNSGAIRIGDSDLIRYSREEGKEMPFFQAGYTTLICNEATGLDGKVEDIALEPYKPEQRYSQDPEMDKTLTTLLQTAGILNEDWSIYSAKEGDMYKFEIFQEKPEKWLYAQFSMKISRDSIEVTGTRYQPGAGVDMPMRFEEKYSINEFTHTGRILNGKKIPGNEGKEKDAVLFIENGLDFSSLSEASRSLATDYIQKGSLVIPNPLHPKSSALIYHPSISAWQ